jgi:hypothetical protein
MAEKREVKKITVDEFMKQSVPAGADRLLSQFNGGSFMDCHQKIFAAYGIWVEELVPVFQKFDQLIVFRPLPAELR